MNNMWKQFITQSINIFVYCRFSWYNEINSINANLFLKQIGFKCIFNDYLEMKWLFFSNEIRVYLNLNSHNKSLY